MEIPNDLATTAVSVGISVSASVSLSEAEKKTEQIISYWLAPLAPGAGSLPGPPELLYTEAHSKYIAYLHIGAHIWLTFKQEHIICLPIHRSTKPLSSSIDCPRKHR